MSNEIKKSWSGLFLIDKPEGLTSHDVVFKLRKILKEKQIGHTGTLDPMATGLMLCLVGPAVKLLPYMGNENKKYELTLKLGVVTDSWDMTGRVIKELNPESLKLWLKKYSQNRSLVQVMENLIGSLTGELDLPVPMYSAKKVDGKKLYELARSSESDDLETFEGPKKQMRFWDLEILNWDWEQGEIRLSFWCSKGSFVRSWVYELGKKLEIGASLKVLKRLAIDNYLLESAKSLDVVRETIESSLSNSYLSLFELVKKFENFEIDVTEKNKIENGLLSYAFLNRLSSLCFTSENIMLIHNNRLVAVLQIKPEIRIKRVFKED